MINPLRLLAKTPVPYSTNGALISLMQGIGRWAQTSQLEAMGGNATVFSIINKTSTATAKADWHAHRLNVRGAVCEVCELENVQHVGAHPALKVINHPNDFYTRQALVETVQQHVDLTGEGWVAIARVGTVPVEIWPVRPDRITVVASPTDFIQGYKYHSPDGKEVPIDVEDMLRIKMPNPTDPFRGMGPIQTIAYNLDSARYSAEWNRNFFKNGAKPGGVVKITETMNDREWKKFKERWYENHEGVANAHRVAFLSGGAEWVDNKLSQKDMQFVELSRLDREVIREAFGISKFAIGDLEDVNRATAEAATLWFSESLTVPRLDRWHGLFNGLVRAFPQYRDTPVDVEVVYTSPVPADREADREDKSAKVTNYVALVNAGVEPTEAARIAGLPPMRHVQRQETGAVA